MEGLVPRKAGGGFGASFGSERCARHGGRPTPELLPPENIPCDPFPSRSVTLREKREPFFWEDNF